MGLKEETFLQSFREHLASRVAQAIPNASAIGYVDDIRAGKPVELYPNVSRVFTTLVASWADELELPPAELQARIFKHSTIDSVVEVTNMQLIWMLKLLLAYRLLADGYQTEVLQLKTHQKLKETQPIKNALVLAYQEAGFQGILTWQYVLQEIFLKEEHEDSTDP